MSELRWTLLVIGVVFVGVLAWWERRRPRQAWVSREASGGESARAVVSPPILQSLEPWIGEAELSEVVLSDVALTAAATDAQPQLAPSAAALDPLAELPTLVIADSGERIGPQIEAAVATLEPIEPCAAAAAACGSNESPDDVGLVRVSEPASAEPPPAPGEPIVEWPPEESRRILALRLVATAPERFPGRTLRLALASEGFVLGKFSIFHKIDDGNRAIVSVASLTRPGSFDPETIDSQRYAGLSLFAVLPGPLPPRQAFEQLLAAARNLNERLAGALQDENGSPLTPLRVASLRDSLESGSAAGP